jgi:dTDP-glucose pyrophosphorylase
MINILMLLAGKSKFFEAPEYQFPRPLIEINGRSMVELTIDNLKGIKQEKRFIFVVNEQDCAKYHIDNVLMLATDDNCKIVRLTGETKGAACSALLATEYIDNKDRLIISNTDQIIEEDINKILDFFEKKDADGGVVCFETIHPRWSYVTVNKNDEIIEAAEKKPISKNAIAGFYYFKHGCDFVKSAMGSIEKDTNVNGAYYIAPTFNEMVLENKSLVIFRLDSNKYHSFYSPQRIREYENR